MRVVLLLDNLQAQMKSAFRMSALLSFPSSARRLPQSTARFVVFSVTTPTTSLCGRTAAELQRISDRVETSNLFSSHTAGPCTSHRPGQPQCVIVCRRARCGESSRDGRRGVRLGHLSGLRHARQRSSPSASTTSALPARRRHLYIPRRQLATAPSITRARRVYVPGLRPRLHCGASPEPWLRP